MQGVAQRWIEKQGVRSFRPDLPLVLVPNTLYFGDNLDILRRYVDDASVDLVYLDPPFNSAQDYNVLFKTQSGDRSPAQIKAFEDTWRWDAAAARAFEEVVTGEGQQTVNVPVSQTMQAFRKMMGENDMLAYLSMMAPRLVELHRVLKPTGSLYLHCDPTASHYLKLLLDAVFEPQHFRSEVIWKRTNVHSDSKDWSAVHDTILYYAKRDGFAWNPQYQPYSEEYVQSKYRHKDPDGRRFQLDNMTSPSSRPNMMYEWKGHASPPNGWRYSKETMAQLDEEGRVWYPDSKEKRLRLKRYLDEMPGVLASDVWEDIRPLNSQAAERLGYPTQKPVALLERIIEASSDEGDVVLDPFCGCGTTIDAAQKLGRRWIGIDVTHLAVSLIKHRLRDTYETSIDYEVVGEPTSLDGAQALAEQDRHQFEYWALGLVGARPQQTKKGADRGIDGRIFFHDEKKAHDQASARPGQVRQGQRPRRARPRRDRGPRGRPARRAPHARRADRPDEARGRERRVLPVAVHAAEVPPHPDPHRRRAAGRLHDCDAAAPHPEHDVQARPARPGQSRSPGQARIVTLPLFCHPERSEGSPPVYRFAWLKEILRLRFAPLTSAQDDTAPGMTPRPG